MSVEQSERDLVERRLGGADLGQDVDAASDEVNAAQAAEAFARVIGRRLDAEQIAASRLGPGLQALFAWLERTGHDVDIRALHARYPEVSWHSYEAWLAVERTRLAAALCPREHAGVS